MSTEIAIIKNSGLEQPTQEIIAAAFAPFLEQVKEWKEKAYTLVVTDVSQVKEMKEAREARLGLKGLRVASDKVRKSLKEESLKYGSTVQAVYNLIESEISPIEGHLEKQEKFKERKEAEMRAARHAARLTELEPYIAFVPAAMIPQLADLDDAGYAGVLKYGMDQKQKADDEAAEQKRLQKEEAQREEKKQAKYNQLFAMGLKFDGEQFAYKDINFHWTDIVCMPDDEFALAVKNCTRRMSEIKLEEEQEAAGRQARLDELKKQGELQSSRLKQLLPFLIRHDEVAIDTLWQLSQEEFDAVLLDKRTVFEVEEKRLADERAEQDRKAQAFEAQQRQLRDAEDLRQAELDKGDKGSLFLLVQDLEALKGKYIFKSKRNQKLGGNVNELINKVIAYIHTNS